MFTIVLSFSWTKIRCSPKFLREQTGRLASFGTKFALVLSFFLDVSVECGDRKLVVFSPAVLLMPVT